MIRTFTRWGPRLTQVGIVSEGWLTTDLDGVIALGNGSQADNDFRPGLAAILAAPNLARTLILPAPLPIAGLVAVPHVLAPAVPLERRVVLGAVVGRWRLGLESDDGGSGIGEPTWPGKKTFMRQAPLNSLPAHIMCYEWRRQSPQLVIYHEYR